MAFLKLNHLKDSVSRPMATCSVMLLLALFSITGCGSNSSETNEAQSRDISCVTGKVTLQRVPLNVTATGGLEADKSVMVSTRMMGWIKEIHVVENQVVSKGDMLISIDAADLRAKKAQAEAGISEAKAVLANAQRMAARFEKLFEEKSVSKQQLDDVLTGRDRAAAGVEMAKAGLREVNVHLSYLNIVAPVDGIVARKMAEEGNMANPGMPLLVLESTDRMKVIAFLGEKDVSAVKAGDMVQVDVTSLAGASFTVPLDRVIQSANPGSRTYDIETYLDNSDGRLKSGMFARVTVPVGTREAILAPGQAIIRRGQLTGVWTVDEQSILHLRWIRLGHELGDQVEVLSGLAGHETVVLSSVTPPAEGDKAVR
jgi:RND family efflux transporter MFP subunit